MALALLVTMVNMGPDAPIYVSEVHAVKGVIDPIDVTVRKVAEPVPEHPFWRHYHGVNSKVWEVTLNVLNTVGAVPNSGGPGTAYSTVY